MSRSEDIHEVWESETSRYRDDSACKPSLSDYDSATRPYTALDGIYGFARSEYVLGDFWWYADRMNKLPKVEPGPVKVLYHKEDQDQPNTEK